MYKNYVTTIDDNWEKKRQVFAMLNLCRFMVTLIYSFKLVGRLLCFWACLFSFLFYCHLLR